MAGPFGTLFGAAVGIGIDYTTNVGIELMNRDEFLKDVKGMVKGKGKNTVIGRGEDKGKRK